MRELALLPGRDYLFKTRWACSDASRFPLLAAELLTLHPAAVVADTNLAIMASRVLFRSSGCP